jgi:hypothetical protein
LIDFVKEFIDVGTHKNLDIKTIIIPELLAGVNEEMEHTTNKVIALKIVLDHLAENPHYYSILKKAGL